jgi:hypothetical protein
MSFLRNSVCVVLFTTAASAQAVIPYSRMGLTPAQLEAASNLFSRDPGQELPAGIDTVARASVEIFFREDLEDTFDRTRIELTDDVFANDGTRVAGRYTARDRTIRMVWWFGVFGPAWYCATLAHEYIHAVNFDKTGDVDAAHDSRGYTLTEQVCNLAYAQ